MPSIALRPCLAALALFLGMAVPAAADEAPACPLKVFARIEMIDLNNGLVAIPVKVEDRDLYFVLDTGGFINTISQNIVDEMKLQPLPAAAKVYGVGQTMDSYVIFKSFSIGPMNGSDMHFYVEPVTVPGIAGALGPDTMRNFDVDFDFAGGKFGIFSSDHCPGRVVYWTKDPPIAALPMEVDRNGHVRMTVKLDGKDLTAVLDTGSDTSIMSMAAAKQYLGIDEKKTGLRKRTVTINGARHKTYAYPFQSLNIADVAINNPSVLILEDADMNHMGTDLILGMNALRQLHIYIAYQEGKLYLTPAAAH